MVLVIGSCAHRSSFREVRFTAPTGPDAALRPFLADVKRLGVLCTTDVEPLVTLDIEKVLARLGNAIVYQLSNRRDLSVTPQDEIRWQLKSVEMDSALVIAEVTRRALVDSMALDALVVVELQRLQARSTPVRTGPYGSAGGQTGQALDLAVDLRMSLINLHTGRIWQRRAQGREWKPVRMQVYGRNQGEQQLLMALGRPLGAFLRRISPPPSRQRRQFDLGEH